MRILRPSNIAALSEILKKQLPKDSEAIRCKENEIVVLTQVKEKAPLFMVMEDTALFTEMDLAAGNAFAIADAHIGILTDVLNGKEKCRWCRCIPWRPDRMTDVTIWRLTGARNCH